MVDAPGGLPRLRSPHALTGTNCFDLERADRQITIWVGIRNSVACMIPNTAAAEGSTAGSRCKGRKLMPGKI